MEPIEFDVFRETLTAILTYVFAAAFALLFWPILGLNSAIPPNERQYTTATCVYSFCIFSAVPTVLYLELLMDATTFEQVAFVIVSLASLGVVSFTVYYAIHPPISYREKRENNAIEYVQRILRRTPPNAQAITSTPEAPEGTNEKNRILCFDGKYFDTVADLTRHLKDIHHLSDDDLLSRPLSSFTLQPYQSKYFRYPTRLLALFLMSAVLVVAIVIALFIFGQDIWDWIGDEVDNKRICLEFDLEGDCVRYECSGDVSDTYYVGAVANMYASLGGFKKLCLEMRCGKAELHPRPADFGPTKGKAGMIAPPVEGLARKTDAERERYFRLQSRWRLALLLHSRPALVAFRDQRSRSTIVAQEFEREQKGNEAGVAAELSDATIQARLDRHTTAFTHFIQQTYHLYKVAELTGIVVLGMLFGFLSMFILVGAVVFLLSYRGLYVLLYSNLGTLLGIFVPLLLGDWLSVESHIWKRVLSKDLQHPSDPYKFSLVDILMTMFAIYKGLVYGIPENPEEQSKLIGGSVASNMHRQDDKYGCFYHDVFAN
eukprot:gene9785-11594_t